MAAFKFTLAGRRSALGRGTLRHELAIPYVEVIVLKAVSSVEAFLVEEGVSCVRRGPK